VVLQESLKFTAFWKSSSNYQIKVPSNLI
jgi:hypothetical protein